MIHVGLFSAGNWPWLRQTPGKSGVWGNCRFTVNGDGPFDYVVVYEGAGCDLTVDVPPARTLFLSGEPMNVKRYPEGFVRQFGTIITSDPALKHPHALVSQTALPWHYGIKTAQPDSYGEALDYDALSTYHPAKTRKISVICSNKTMTPEHRRRLAFVTALKAALGDELDVFGRGFREIDDKAEVLAPYQYHVALENSDYADYWTEKIADPLLGRAFPFYWGCTNLESYLPADSFVRVDINDGEKSAAIIRKAIADNVAEKNQAASEQARQMILNTYNVFAVISKQVEQLEAAGAGTARGHSTLLQEWHFRSAPVALRQRIREKLQKWPRLFSLIYRIYKFVDAMHTDSKDAWQRYKPVIIGWRNHWRRMATDPFYRSHQRWLKQNADEAIRYHYPLDKNSVVFDVGGFEGDWAEKINRTSCCTVHVFEPVPDFINALHQRFAGNGKVAVHAFGLGRSNSSLNITLDGNSSSTFLEGAKQQTVQLRDVTDVIRELGLTRIALMKINIEGGEYDLLERLIESGLIGMVQDIQVQFHLFVPEAKTRYVKLAAQLRKTHRLTWRYPFVWENWQRIGPR